MKELNEDVAGAQARFDASLRRYHSGIGSSTQNHLAMSDAREVLQSAKKYRDAELRKTGTAASYGEIAGRIYNLAAIESAPEIQRDIQRWQTLRNGLPTYKARFARQSATLPWEHVKFWIKPALFWLLSVIIVCVSIETIAWVLRGFLPADEKPRED